MINTQSIITYINEISAKSKVIFLDCCLAGNFSVSSPSVFHINDTVSQFAGNGYAVFASSNAIQSSYPHPSGKCSLFTYFLSTALTHNGTIRKGQKSLFDIHKLLFLLLEIWNKNNPTKKQTPIYRADVGGTIFFKVEDYHPYVTNTFYKETEKYIIYSVQPLHSSIAKRYSVKIILKTPYSFNEIAIINHEIVNEVRHLEIYNNEKQERKWRYKNANLIFSYFGLDETDIINNNYLCHTTWADETQDKEHWYRINSNCEIIDDIHFNIHAYYKTMKSYISEHTTTVEQFITDTKTMITALSTSAEHFISLYNDYQNEDVTEKEFIVAIAPIVEEINRLYYTENQLDIAPNELKEWCTNCSSLAATIHDFTLYYTQKAFLERSPENRKACTDLAIKEYYKCLEDLKNTEKTGLK